MFNFFFKYALKNYVSDNFNIYIINIILYNYNSIIINIISILYKI